MRADNPTAMPSVPSISVSGSLQGRRHRLLVAPVVAGNEIGQLVVENFRAREFRQPALDVTRRRGRVAGEDVAEVALALDEVALVRQHHERVADGRVAVRMILHRVTDDVGDLDERPSSFSCSAHRMRRCTGFNPSARFGNGAVADDVGGVLQKIAVHRPVQRPIDLAGHKHVRAGRRAAFSALASVALMAIASAGFDCGLWRSRLWRRAAASLSSGPARCVRAGSAGQAALEDCDSYRFAHMLCVLHSAQPGSP